MGLASALEALGRSGEAEDLRRVSLARRRTISQPDSPLLANDLMLLGHHLITKSRWLEAEPFIREALAILANATPDAWEHPYAMSLLGGSLLGQGRHAEAEPMAVKGYEGMKARETRIYAPDRYRLLEAAERVVRLYEAWNKPERAAAWKAKLGMRDLPADAFARLSTR
jgi:hypothetical protein